MSESRFRRAALVVALLAAQAGMAVHFGALEGRCPNVECYATNYGQYVGTETTVGGRILVTDPPTVSLPHGSGESLELELIGLAEAVEPGTLVSVHGQLLPGQRLAVDEAVVKPPGNRRFMFAVSALAIMLVVAAGLRYWRVDIRTLTIRRRSGR